MKKLIDLLMRDPVAMGCLIAVIVLGVSFFRAYAECDCDVTRVAPVFGGFVCDGAAP